jgi:hypothetical protein
MKTITTNCIEYGELQKALVHHDTLKGCEESRRQHDCFGAAGAYDAAQRRFIKDVDAIRPQMLQVFLKWAEPFFGASEAGRELAVQAFGKCEAGRILASLTESLSAPGYIARINILNGKIRELEELQSIVALVAARLES